MSVASNSILKLLSDLSAASDKIIEENGSELMLPRVSEWVSIVKNKALSIVESDTEPHTRDVPSLKNFIIGTSQRRRRVSTAFAEIQKSHLHRKSRAGIKIRQSRRSSIKTPLRSTSNVKDSNEKAFLHAENNTRNLVQSPTVLTDKTRIISDSNFSSSSSSTDERKNTLFGAAPVKQNGENAARNTRSSSKRKSSSELPLETVKKNKPVEELSAPKERDPSMQNIRIEKFMKAKNSSLLSSYANIKSSIGANVSVLKENRTLRSKVETKQEKAVENRKNILALRQQKLEQNKRTREEKLERTLQQRMKLEKEKLSKLRADSRERIQTKEATPKILMHKTVNRENETHGETSNSGKNQEKQKKLKTNLKKAGPSVSKSNEKTPVKKNLKNEPEKKVMNTTFVAQGEPGSSSKKGKSLEEENIGTISSDNKIQAQTKGAKPEKPKIEQKKGPESYALTPARSSFVSYDISEIHSDSDEEESKEVNSKRIPAWATGVHLRNALLQQHHHPINTDELFGNFYDTPDLVAIMGVKKKQYHKRTSSAIWHSSFG